MDALKDIAGVVGILLTASGLLSIWYIAIANYNSLCGIPVTILALLVGYRFYWGFARRNLPVSMLFTDITIAPNQKNWAVVTLDRRQMLRANKRGVNQVRFNIIPEYDETLERTDIVAGVESPKGTPQRQDTVRTGANSWTVYQKFDQGLPYVWWGFLVPDWLLVTATKRQSQWPEKFVVVRTVQTIIRGNAKRVLTDPQFFQVSTTWYKQKNLTLTFKSPGPELAYGADIDPEKISFKNKKTCKVFIWAHEESAATVRTTNGVVQQSNKVSTHKLANLKRDRVFGLFWAYGKLT